MREYIIKIAKIIIAALIVTAAIAAMFYGLWRWLILVDSGKLAAFVLFLTLLCPAALGFGYWLGTVRSTGFMRGIDTGIDKLSQAVGLRDNSIANTALKVNHWQAGGRAERQNIIVQLPNAQLPAITHRQADGSDILDL